MDRYGPGWRNILKDRELNRIAALGILAAICAGTAPAGAQSGNQTGIQTGNQAFDLSLCRGGGQLVVNRDHAGLFGETHLGADIDLAGWILADEDNRKGWLAGQL